MKKIISMLLTVCLLLSAFPLIASAVAAPEPVTEPVTYPVAEEKNLIVLDNMEIEEPVYICLRTGENASEETTIRAKMEFFDFSDYGEPRYRFTYPDGMQYFYFTNGKKSTQEVPIDCFSPSTHVYLPGSIEGNGLYNVEYYDWCGGTDPAFTKGPSHTLFDRFCEEYVFLNDGGFDNSFTDLYQLYDEIFEHQDNTGKIDWVLVHAESFVQLTVVYEGLIGNRVVTRSTVGAPFDSGYGIYDVKQDRFIPLNGTTVEVYDGLKAAFDKLGEGKLLGDINGDNTINVIDATMIQRCAAKITEYPEGDEMVSPIGSIRYYSDFNRDGNRNVLDATAIQRYLIGM